jgi:hypothetical protein
MVRPSSADKQAGIIVAKQHKEPDNYQKWFIHDGYILM